MSSVLAARPHDDRYRPLAVLGQGGMARVLLAADGPHAEQKLVVLKEMLPELRHDTEFVTMFRDEARLASKLDHPNLVRTHELVDEPGRCFFVMEHIDGHALSALVARVNRDVQLPILLHVLTELLAGLHYAHEVTDGAGKPLSVIHRDVTPQNILISYRGEVKLIDFGIAKAAGAGVKTQTGVFKGKLSYAAPEQLGDEPLDRRVDVFAVGVILWEGLAKRRIAKDMSDAAMFGQRLRGDPPVTDIAPDTPPTLATICSKAMASKRDERYPSADAMKVDLDRAIDELGLRTTNEAVGKLIAALFAKERAQTQATIAARLAISTTPAIDELPMSDLEPDDSDSLDASAPISTVRMDTFEPAPARKRRLVIPIVAGIAVLGLIVCIRLVSSRPKPAEPLLASVSASPPAAVSAPAPEPDQVDLSVVVTPALSVVMLDNVSLGPAPYRGEAKRDGAVHTLVVTHAGYKRLEREITLDHDLTLELSLELEKPVDKGAARAVKPRGPSPAPYAKW